MKASKVKFEYMLKSNSKSKKNHLKSEKKQKLQELQELSVTLITGASAGIGAATALYLASHGEALVLIARRQDRLREIKKKCLAAGAPVVEIFSVDLLKKKSVEKFVQDLTAKKIIVNSQKTNLVVKNLINNAGLAKGVQLIPQADFQDWETMIDTNIKSVMLLTRLLCHTIVRQRGHIVNLGSVAGRLVYEGGAVYCATKFAIRAFSEGLRMDLKGTGVRVTNISPGMVNTEFSLVRLGDQKKADQVYAGMTPLSSEDIARTIGWCLQQPPHVNVQELVIYPTDQASVGQVYRQV